MSSEESWHAIEAQEALINLKSGKIGLSSTEAAERLKKYGPNQLAAGEKTSPLKIFIRPIQKHTYTNSNSRSNSVVCDWTPI